jgi:hypothetical protein
MISGAETRKDKGRTAKSASRLRLSELLKADRNELIGAVGGSVRKRWLDLAPWVRFALDPSAPVPRGTAGSGLVLAESIRRLRDTMQGGKVPDLAPNRLVIGRDLDVLGDPDDLERWSAAQCLNLILLRQITPVHAAAVVGTMRDDGIYALEWIAHYKELGFERVIIYTNDNADGSEQLLRCLAEHNEITLIESETAGTVRPEVKAFQHAIHLLHDLREFEWVLFVDSDELLILAPYYQYSISRVLQRIGQKYPAHPPSAVLYQWLWFVSGMIYGREPGLLMERFQHAHPHWLTKTLVRLPDLQSMILQHRPVLRPGCFAVDSELQRFDLARAFEQRAPRYAGGYLAHYWAKSFEEFSLKKARGDSLNIEDNEYKRDFSLFFSWNRAETAATLQPVDRVFLRRVKKRIALLRELEGVAEKEQEINRRFGQLLSRYDRVGGLRKLYAEFNREPDPS